MNKLEKLKVPLKELQGGHKLELTLFRLTGTRPGPHVHVQANVHGAELQGNAAIFRLLEFFQKHPFNGTMTLIPHANPMGEITKIGTGTYGRFNPITGDNWNRLYENLLEHPKSITGLDLDEFCNQYKDSPLQEIKNKFRSYIHQGFSALEAHYSRYGMSENKKLFLMLQKIAAPADIVLDLHTGPTATRYIYSAEYQKESVKHFHFPHVLNFPNEFAGAMDEASMINWLKLSRKLKELGREMPVDFEAYTVELGSEEVINFKDAENDCLCILHYLHHKKVIDEVPRRLPDSPQTHCLLKDYKTYYAPRGGLVEFTARPGQRVAAGQELYRMLLLQDIKEEGVDSAVISVKAINDCVVINHIPSGNVGQGAELYQVMENHWQVTP